MDKLAKIRKILISDHGWKNSPYFNEFNQSSWGVGFKCTDDEGKVLTIYHDLPDKTYADLEINEKLNICIEEYEQKFSSNKDICDAYAELNDVRQCVLLSMAHQFGFYGMLCFKDMWHCIRSGDYAKAAIEILYSKAANDPKLYGRMMRNSEMMRTGKLHTFYLQK